MFVVLVAYKAFNRTELDGYHTIHVPLWMSESLLEESDMWHHLLKLNNCLLIPNFPSRGVDQESTVLYKSYYWNLSSFSPNSTSSLSAIVLSTWCHVISSWCFSSLTDRISARQYTGGSIKGKEWGQGSDLPGSWDTPAFWRYRSKGHLGFSLLDLHMNVSHTHKHFKWYVCKQSST